MKLTGPTCIYSYYHTSSTTLFHSKFYVIDIFSGHYMYIETSAPVRPGQKARLLSQLVNPSGSTCISFYYHMYGRNIANLNVYVKEQSSSGTSSLGQPIWKRNGNQQNKWIVGQFTITPSQSFRVGTNALEHMTTIITMFIIFINPFPHEYSC